MWRRIEIEEAARPWLGNFPPDRVTAANACCPRAGTTALVNRPGANRLDRRRTLTPRAYIPRGFGSTPEAKCVVPPGGDPVSAAVARVQHDLVLRYKAVRRHGDRRRLGRTFGISESAWSRCLSGEQFMGGTVMAALLYGIHGW
ncbi:hypothetical protein JKP75_13230 [Blastococcus sp. TML/M2B]|uniref:hypothetical protein n=1 Tax=unclassified Blastococcus TaxID=2619396 RepID=UPI00190A750D|nr:MULTISPECIES: hypothetical protein [unclassified Blastococcus]MBN1093440.1 hypothetical protein [Blastococcus sp. TML/M2B]MBN1096443.1 hypothetical protein [Blastococcus sp. TML/C7B]